MSFFQLHSQTSSINPRLLALQLLLERSILVRVLQVNIVIITSFQTIFLINYKILDN